TSVTPNSIQRGTSSNVTVTGGNFAPGATLGFENGQGPAPSVSNLVVVDADTITATVTVRSGGPRRNRDWDVVVTNPDGQSGRLDGAFTVTP
ncbi:MAG: hypothetical protein ACYSTG_03695, partial [Planctomycetota bacterium]